MSEENYKVNFREKERSVAGAWFYFYGLKLGIIKANLRDYEKIGYNLWKENKKDKNKRAKELLTNQFKKETEDIFKNLTEKDYLLENLESKIVSTLIAKKGKYCRTHGHKKKKNSAYYPVGLEGKVIHYTCARCGTIYEEG